MIFDITINLWYVLSIVLSIILFWFYTRFLGPLIIIVRAHKRLIPKIHRILAENLIKYDLNYDEDDIVYSRNYADFYENIQEDFMSCDKSIDNMWLNNIRLQDFFEYKDVGKFTMKIKPWGSLNWGNFTESYAFPYISCADVLEKYRENNINEILEK